MRDVLTTAMMLTGFAGFAAAIGALVYVGASAITPVLLRVVDHASSIAIAARLAG